METPNRDHIKKLINWLQGRVTMAATEPTVVVEFDRPAVEDFRAAGFGEDMIAISLHSPWWAEMVTDIIETPEFAEPEASPEQVLQYARDVVHEYIAKRLNP
ncbi:MAG: hypothetical protein GY839_17880 [candidate division Zixibacteria bacterium]|nr:hypothetical protein [candidate division Zixibacteria bacterium]